MSLHAYVGLIEAFGSSIGLPDVRTDRDGHCALSFDAVVVHFQYVGEDDSITLLSRLGIANKDRIEGVYALLLTANMFWRGARGCTLSLEQGTTTVFIGERRPRATLTDASFSTWVGHFVDTAEYWTSHLAEANEGKLPLPGTERPTSETGTPDLPYIDYMTRV